MKAASIIAFTLFIMSGAARADFTVTAPQSSLPGAPRRTFLHFIEDGLWHFAACADGEINPARSTCRDVPGELPAAKVSEAPRPAFGGGMEAFLEDSRRWAVEMRRVDARLGRSLSTELPDDVDAVALEKSLSALSERLAKVDARVIHLKDELTRLEERLASHPDDAEARNQLVTTREACVKLTTERQAVAQEYSDLSARLHAARQTLDGNITFSMLVSQFEAAVARHREALKGLAAEENRRLGLDRAVALAADKTFAFRFDDGLGGDFPLEKSAALALHAAATKGFASTLTFHLLPTQPQYTSCWGGIYAGCGIRTSMTIPAAYALSRVSCRIIGGKAPCKKLFFDKVGTDGFSLGNETTFIGADPLEWTAGSRRIDASGTWSAIAQCGYGPEDELERFGGRIACDIQLE